MLWRTLSAVYASLFGITFVCLIPRIGYASTLTPGDVIVEIRPETLGRSPRLNSYPPPVPTTIPAPEYPSFNSAQLDRQFKLYTTYLERFGPPDILIVGSSRALQGVDPVILQTALAQQGYPNLKVFNFGINGATAQVVNWLLQTLLQPDQLPKMVLWADGVRAFNSGRIDHTFNKIIRSKGHQALLAGLRPTAPSTGVKLGQVCMDMWPLPLPLAQKKSALALEHSTLTTSVERSRHNFCQQPVKVTLKQPPQQLTNLANSPDPLASLGLQIVETRFSPATYYRRYPKVPGRYDADYRNFHLHGNQAEAAEQVVQFATTRNIPLVFVNLPLTSTYLDFTRSTYEAQFRQKMQNLARSNQFVFKDLVLQPQLSRNHYFADPSHLNRFGAIAVSNYLSQELPRSLARYFPYSSRKTEEEQLSATPRLFCKYACLYIPLAFTG